MIPTLLYTRFPCVKLLQELGTRSITSNRKCVGILTMVLSRQESIRKQLSQALLCTHLEIIDESHRHHVPEGAQTHFKAVIVSDVFKNKRLIERHRMINALLANEFQNGLHALALHTYTAEEWSKKHHSSPASPNCRGGHKHDNSSTKH